MNRLIDPRTYWRVVLTAITLLLFSLVCIPAANSAVAQETPAPTVGEIAFESYNCETGSLIFSVPVTDLPRDPRGIGTLGYSASADYTQGSDENVVPGFGYNPSFEIAPYTGDLRLPSYVPSTNEFTESPGSLGTITSTTIFVGVSAIASEGYSDTSEATFPVDCGDSNDDLVQQLIATLIAILQSILKEQ
jgi:streptogramin lyase